MIYAIQPLQCTFIDFHFPNAKRAPVISVNVCWRMSNVCVCMWYITQCHSYTASLASLSAVLTWPKFPGACRHIALANYGSCVLISPQPFETQQNEQKMGVQIPFIHPQNLHDLFEH